MKYTIYENGYSCYIESLQFIEQIPESRLTKTWSTES